MPAPIEIESVKLEKEEKEEKEEKDKEGESVEKTRQDFIIALERISKGSVLGRLLLPLLAIMSDPQLCTLPLATTFLKHITTLGKKNAEVGGVALVIK